MRGKVLPSRKLILILAAALWCGHVLAYAGWRFLQVPFKQRVFASERVTLELVRGGNSLFIGLVPGLFVFDRIFNRTVRLQAHRGSISQQGEEYDLETDIPWDSMLCRSDSDTVTVFSRRDGVETIWFVFPSK